MPPRAKKSDIKDDEWEKFQPVIRRLYLIEDKSLKDLVAILSISYDFRPSKAQLEWKLTQWRMTKKMTTSEWKYVDHRIRNRNAAGKKSRVYLSGIRLRDATIEKAKVRHCYETALEKSMGVVAPPSPTNLSLIIRTPSPQRIPEPDDMHGIPWLTAISLIRGLDVLIPSRVDKRFQLPGDKLLMLATGRPLVHVNHTARLQSTFEALSLIMPEQLQQDHVYHAESLLLSSKHDSNITGALQVGLFLLSNNFLDRVGNYYEEQNKVIEVLLDVLPQTDGWATLMSQQYTELPVSIQSALDRLFKEAVLRSDLNLIRSLTQMGVDANQLLNLILIRYKVSGAASAFEFAMFTNNCPLIQLLVELDANRPGNNLQLILSAWKYRNTPLITLESMTFLLSNFVFCQENDEDGDEDEETHSLLLQIASGKACPITEQIFEFFRTRLHTLAAKLQLLTSAIRARSKILPNLLSENREHVGAYVNHLTAYGATPIMAAIEVGDTKILERLIHLGASLDPPPPSSSTSCSPLQYAAYVSDTDMLQKILWHGAKINYCHHSISRIVDDTYEFGSDPTHIGKTALQSALLGCKVGNAIFLLEAGATLVGSELAIAIASRQNAVVDELLARGASLAETSTTSDTLSILEAAVLTEDMALLSQIINDNSQAVGASSLWAAIFVAGSTSNLSIFEFLLGHVSVTSQWEDLCLGTAMCLAAILGVLEIVELMLASGLRPEKCLIVGCETDTRSIRQGYLKVPDDYVLWRQEISVFHIENCSEHGLLETALSLVNARGTSFLILLRQHGYHRTVRCPEFGHCPSLEHLQTLQSFGVEMTSIILSNSIGDESHDVTEWLLASGVDVNVTNDDTSVRIPTPIQVAARQGNLPLVERLKNLGADINAPAGTKRGTALQYASMRGYFGMVRRLLEFQADPNAPRGWFGRTALEGAAANGRLDIVQLLLNSGVETLGSGHLQYIRAIRYAHKEGHHAVARLIKSHRLWEEADQRLFDDNDLLDHDYTCESDEGTDEETDEEYESSRGTSEAEFEASGVSCEVPGENIEVDDEKGSDFNTDFSEDEEFSESPALVSDNIEEGFAYDVEERVERPEDAGIWAEAYKAFSSEPPWSM